MDCVQDLQHGYPVNEFPGQNAFGGIFLPDCEIAFSFIASGQLRHDDRVARRIRKIEFGKQGVRKFVDIGRNRIGSKNSYPIQRLGKPAHQANICSVRSSCGLILYLHREPAHHPRRSPDEAARLT